MTLAIRSALGKSVMKLRNYFAQLKNLCTKALKMQLQEIIWVTSAVLFMKILLYLIKVVEETVFS